MHPSIRYQPCPRTRGAFENRTSFSQNSHCQGEQGLYLLKQTHGDMAVQVTADLKKEQLSEIKADALYTDLPNIPLGIKTADCVPVLLAHPKGVVGAVHAGWRGTQKKILWKTVKTLSREFSLNLKDLYIAIGPSICGNCFEVGAEVVEQFSSSELTGCLKKGDNGKFFIDLKQLNLNQAQRAGVLSNNIHCVSDCTLCLHEKYYSYRYRQKKGSAESGRNYSWIEILS